MIIGLNNFSMLIIGIFKKISGILRMTLFRLLRKSIGNNEWVWPRYRIPGLRNVMTRDNLEQKYPFANFNHNSSFELMKFTIDISEKIARNEPFSLLRLGDGEMYFLQGNIVGNLIKRHGVSKNIDFENIKYITKEILKCDFILLFKNPSMIKLLPKSLNSNLKDSSYDIYTIYQLISSKLLFYLIKNYKIGLIGADEKLLLIEKLMSYDAYRAHMALDVIHDYIHVPQQNCGSNFEETYNLIRKQINMNVDIYLVGIGISKMLVLPRLKEETRKTFIDIGAGIDAMAGIIPHTRSYFGNWNNFRIQNYDYSKLDILSKEIESDFRHGKTTFLPKIPE